MESNSYSTSRRGLVEATVRNGIYAPFPYSLCTLDYLADLRSGKAYAPKFTEVRLAPCPCGFPAPRLIPCPWGLPATRRLIPCP